MVARQRRAWLFPACALILSLAWTADTAADGVTGACCFADSDCAEYTEVFCATAHGFYQGNGTFCSGVSCPCLADVDGSGQVDFADLINILASWGPCPDPCFSDFDGNLVVDVIDLLHFLSSWGPCP